MKKKTTWEWCWFTKRWDWPTFVFFGLEIEMHRSGDHSPGYRIDLTILGVGIVECSYYNIYHMDN
jgi:hypothetical protein